ncbi:MAG TPA: enoyl-CoA hydratase-related protein [Oligoflexia bacterium]|nr:enoyl-CoA hydratase-related protein [Oligoflexia bacterium]HMR23986.1 enoyl-CoA hydratase-related protein [Oligoflexia bacterium]
MLDIQHTKQQSNIILNRPEQGNALTESMLIELSEAFNNLPKTSKILTISANGKHFCAGADLNWMRQAKDLSEKENLASAQLLFNMYLALYNCSIPVITHVQGAVMGGALGLVACSDIVIAQDNAFFSLSEAKLGIVPATISPFVIQKLGYSQFLALSLQARKFTAQEALSYGLIHSCITGKDQSKKVFDVTCEDTLNNSPYALKIIKQLSRKYLSFKPENFAQSTSELIAKCRVSYDGQEGLNAFFEKRKPQWGKV